MSDSNHLYYVVSCRHIDLNKEHCLHSQVHPELECISSHCSASSLVDHPEVGAEIFAASLIRVDLNAHIITSHLKFLHLLMLGDYFSVRQKFESLLYLNVKL